MSASSPRDGEQTPPKQSESPGRRLRVARQAIGLSHEKVATQLHLSVPMVQALEADDFDRLPGPVFVRGYLRNYARLVAADEQAVLHAYETHQPPAPEARPRIHPSVQPEIRSSHFGVRLVSLVIVVALAALLGIWWQGHLTWNGTGPEPYADTPVLPEEAAENGALPLPEPAVVPAVAASASASAAEPEPPVAAAETAPAVEVALPEPEPEPAAAPSTAVAEEPASPPADLPVPAGPEPEVVPETASPAPEPPAVEQEGVVFEFLGPCWVDIRDSTRTFKLLGEIGEGERRTLGGTPPYSVILGNSGMVRVTVDGEPFDVERYSRGSVARFTLDPDNRE